MKAAGKCAVALVTAPDLKTARRLAKAALSARLIACANLVPRVESHYRWQGKLERGAEVLLVLKTTTARLARLEKLILARHPYDTAEFIVLPLRSGSKRYLDWLNGSCRES
jgi:periplasmic divalent cation tolerance protein